MYVQMDRAHWNFLMSYTYSAVVLDIMLPKVDGLTVVRKIREKGNDVPILLLTAKGDLDDRVKGLNAGADDYLVKPFEFDEPSGKTSGAGPQEQAENVSVL